MSTELKLLNFDTKNKKEHPANIYHAKFPLAKDFVYAIMEAYQLSLRSVGEFAIVTNRKSTEADFQCFINTIFTAETYSKEFRKYRRKILVRCNLIDLKEQKAKEEDFNKYEIQLRKLE